MIADSPKRRDGGGSVVVCPDCELRKGVETPNEAVAFYRRHAAITGHDVDWERADVDGLETVTDDDPRAMIRTLEERFPEGVPIGVVTAAASRQGATIGETVDAIRELRMGGELYEPRDDHLGVT